MVIGNDTLVLPGTPPGTNSCHPCGTSDSTHTDENTIIHGDKPTCPIPADGIGLMSECDPSVENAIEPNFNDNISNNGLNLVTITATTSIYSLYSENSRNHVYLYAAILTADGTRTKPMTGIFIKTFQDGDTEFPSANSPPTTDALQPIILV